MGKITKSFALLLFLTIAISCVIFIKSTNAQAIPKPSIPTFALKFIQIPNNVPFTDPSTGATVTKEINFYTIQVTIKNQPFENYYDPNSRSNISLYYDAEAKNHYTNNWTDCYTTGNYPLQSDSEYTTLNISSNFTTGAQNDFRVRAIIGNMTIIFDPNSNPYPSSISNPTGGGYGYSWSIVKTSDWSNMQTITTPETTLFSVNSTPTTTIPEFSWLAILPLLLSIIAVSALFGHRNRVKKI